MLNTHEILANDVFETNPEANNSYLMTVRKIQLRARLEVIMKMLKFLCRRKTGVTPELEKASLDSERIALQLKNDNLSTKELENMLLTCEKYLNRYS